MMNWNQTTGQSSQPNPETGATSSNARQMAYAAPPYQQPEMPGVPASAFPASSTQFPYQQAHQFHLQQQLQQQQQHQMLQAFWAERALEIQQATNFKNHSLPLARVKKVMKARGEAEMVSAEAPVVLAKACELLIQELTLRGWMHAVENRQTRLEKSNIAAAISRTDVFDFLANIVQRGALNEGGVGIPGAAEPMPYPYNPTQHQVGASGMYAAPQPPPEAYMPWQFSAAPQPPPDEAYVPWQFPQPQSTHVSAALHAPPEAYVPWQFSQPEPTHISAAPQPPPGEYMSWQFLAAPQSSSGSYTPWQFSQSQPTQQQQQEQQQPWQFSESQQQQQQSQQQPWQFSESQQQHQHQHQQ